MKIIDTEEEYRRLIAGTILDRPEPTRIPYVHLAVIVFLVVASLMVAGWWFGRAVGPSTALQRASGPTVELITEHGIKTTERKTR